MALKTNLTPLDDVDLLDGEREGALRNVNVTTVEELVGQLEADPLAVADLLHLSARELARLRRRALATLRPEVRAAFLAPHDDYALGALDPNAR
jgi:hypothetical protein